MDFQGQKLAEQLCLYIICIVGAIAFALGWVEGSFALMMKVSPLRWALDGASDLHANDHVHSSILVSFAGVW